MDLPTFLNHFHTIADSPNGIPKLRSLILDLAVRGKLVPQDPEDEPVEKLLKAIELERNLLVEQGQLRKGQFSKSKAFDASKFLVPNSWKVVSAENAFLVITDEDHQPPPKSNDGIPFLVIGNVSKKYLDFSQTRFVSLEYFENLDWSRKPEKGDILYTVTGS
jgi:type I restriction enzyme, S subunit